MYRKRGEEGGEGNKMVVSLARLVDTILKHSRGSPLHIVFITDMESKDQVRRGGGGEQDGGVPGQAGRLFF